MIEKMIRKKFANSDCRPVNRFATNAMGDAGLYLLQQLVHAELLAETRSQPDDLHVQLLLVERQSRRKACDRAADERRCKRQNSDDPRNDHEHRNARGNANLPHGVQQGRTDHGEKQRHEQRHEYPLRRLHPEDDHDDRGCRQ